jgi:putative exosortase-associated protein (TIGR04073 family)
MGFSMNNIFRLLLVTFVLFTLSPQMVMAYTYPTKVGEKLGNGLANVVTGVAEIPKTMIVTSKREGVAYGMTAGFFTGIVHMVGRTLTGAVDIATFFVPTTPIVRPPYIWEDFDRETTYIAWRMR